MKKITIVFIISLICISYAYTKQKIVLTLNPNVHMLDEKKNGKYLITKLKPKTRYFVKVIGHAWLSDQKGHQSDPVYGIMTYYREYKNGKSVDSYRILKHRDRFVFTTSAQNPVFAGFIMELYSKRNNRGYFKIILREL
jgi:hypothetical protein